MREPVPPRAGFQSYASPPGGTGTFTPLSLSSPSWNRQRGQACRRPWGNGQVTGYSGTTDRGRADGQPRGHLAGETEAKREGDAAGRRTHTGSASAESQEPLCRRGCHHPHFTAGEMEVQGDAHPQGSQLPHVSPWVLPQLSRLQSTRAVWVVPCGVSWGPDLGRGAWPRWHGSLRP